MYSKVHIPYALREKVLTNLGPRFLMLPELKFLMLCLK